MKKISSKSSKQYQNTKKIAAHEKSVKVLHICFVSDTEVEMVRLSWCASTGGGAKCELRSSYWSWLLMAKLEYGFLCSREYIHSTSCQTELSSRFKKKENKNKPVPADSSVSLSVQLCPRTTIAFTIAVCFVVVLSRSACVCSHSSGCTPPGR